MALTRPLPPSIPPPFPSTFLSPPSSPLPIFPNFRRQSPSPLRSTGAIHSIPKLAPFKPAGMESSNESQQNHANGDQKQGQQNGSGGRGGQQAATTAAVFQPHFFQQQHPHIGHHLSSPFGQAGTQMGPEAMQAFANLGLFCAPSGHQQFPVPGPTSVPPHLAVAAAAAAGYGQRLMGAAAAQLPGHNGAALARRMPPNQSASCLTSHPSSSSSTASSSSSINRSQRCGVCRGCQCKPCGQCTYCQDSPQFGGPGVKKQSCIERRCLRVLENRLQRDAPTFKARIGCAACEDCRSPDCQICLVCLDRRFFNSKYMLGALCAKKRCNNATALELPISADRSSLKRPSDGGGGPNQQMAKRHVLVPPSPHHQGGQAQQLNSNIARILSAASDGAQQKFVGRSSGGNSSSSTNSPLSECGGGGPQSATPPSLMAAASVPHLATRSAAAAFWTAGPPSQMFLPGQYHFDQMASLAAAAAVGFPAQHQAPHNYPSSYQPKFLNYPKYEYFSAEDGPNGATMANGPAVADSAPADGQMGVQTGGGGTAENLLVPPSYSDIQKVVLQPL